MAGLRVDKPGRKFSPLYYDTEALFVYPNESERLTLKEVPFVSEFESLPPFQSLPDERTPYSIRGPHRIREGEMAGSEWAHGSDSIGSPSAPVPIGS